MPSLEERSDFLTVFNDRLDIVHFGHHTSRVKTPYPRPVASGQDLEFEEIMNGTYRFQLSGHLRRYDTDDVIRDRVMRGSIGAYDLLDANIEFNEATFKELGTQPYYTLARRGGCTICYSAITKDGIWPLAGDTTQFTIDTTNNVAYSLFQDVDSAGLLFWADGSYSFYDFLTKIREPIFTGTNLSKIYLFDKTSVGVDHSGNIYIVTKLGLTPLNRDGDFSVFNNRYIVIQTTDFDDGSISRTELYDMESGLIEVVGNFFPMTTPKMYTQNYFGNKQTQNDQTNQWATSATQVGTVKINPETLEVTVPVTTGDGRYIHAGGQSYLWRDYGKRTNDCGREKLWTAYTPRFPCQDIFVEAGSGILYYTRNFKSYVNSGAMLNAPIHRLHRLRSIRAIGFHEVDMTYNGDNYNPTTQATITLNIQLLLY